MKRGYLFLVSVLFTLVAAFCFASCGEEAKAVETEIQPVIIKVEDVVTSQTTLLDVMEEMQKSGEISFAVADGMVVEINGVKNDADYDPCWMLYTSDTENSSTAWGSYEYGGETLGSANYGAGELPIKSGCVYVWVYQSF
ncbi:MAG: hypothetical protein IJF44_04930 [Clostridia bacterium]|nr:hypothetical protein [Clostridia bacterium]